jgi:hypothetical protein
MIWHIFRKDWKLLWWKVLIVEALLVCGAIATSRQGHFSTGAPPTWETAGALLTFAAGLFLLADLAQLDSPDGTAQDWIARPIRRVDMLLAKLFFLFVAIVPMGLIEAADNLASGFPPGRSLAAALLDMLSALVSTGLPLLAFASLFSTLTETVAAAFIVVLSKMMLGLLFQNGFRFPLNGATTGSAISWVIDLGQSWVYFGGALVVLAIQYFRRRTIRARWVAVVVLAITSFAPLLPWQYAFAVEQRLSPMPGAGASINIVFNPAGGPVSEVLGGTVCIPVVVSGVAKGSWLNIDSVKASLLDDDKASRSYRIAGATEASSSVSDKVRGDLPKTNGFGVCQPISIPLDELKGLEDRPIRVQLDYSLTLFGPDKSYAMPAVGGDQRMPGVGWCQTRVRDRLVELGCISDYGSACLEAWTANAPASTAWFCKPDYDAVRGVDTDPWGGQLNLKVHKGDTLVLRSYQPLDHFERQVTTSEIKLHDWLADFQTAFQ